MPGGWKVATDDDDVSPADAEAIRLWEQLLSRAAAKDAMTWRPADDREVKQ
jgi:hypothetical protein